MERDAEYAEEEQSRAEWHEAHLDVAAREAPREPRAGGDADRREEEAELCGLRRELEHVHAVCHEVDLEERGDGREEAGAGHREDEVGVAANPGGRAPELADEEEVRAKVRVRRRRVPDARRGGDARDGDGDAEELRERVRAFERQGEPRLGPQRPGDGRRERGADDNREVAPHDERGVGLGEALFLHKFRDDAVLRGREERALERHEEEEREKEPRRTGEEERDAERHDSELGVLQGDRHLVLGEAVGEESGVGGEAEKRDGEEDRRAAEEETLVLGDEHDEEHRDEPLEEVVVEGAEELRGVEPAEGGLFPARERLVVDAKGHGAFSLA